jgi:predicted GIY-YIG superfamily endonuclease
MTAWIIKSRARNKKRFASNMPVTAWSASVLVQSTAVMLLSSLKQYRQMRSATEKVPIYCVFGDTVIRSIAQDRPTTEQALREIRGLTDDKCARYGEDILALVRAARPDEPPPAAKPPAVVMRAGKWPRRRSFPSRPALDISQAISTASRRVPGVPAGKEGIYILELAQGRVYVGHSGDVRRRIQQHMAGQGAAFTKAFPPTGVLLPRLGCVTGSPEAAERDETLRYMFLRDIQLVRGWRYVQVQLPEKEQQDAEENIRELFDLCRRCGHPGHFVTQCRANFDRRGRACDSR